MGFKKTLPTYYPFNEVAVTGVDTFNSVGTFIGNLDNIGCQVAYTGTLTGTLTVDISNDDINYDSITFDPVIAQPAGSPVKFGINLNQVPWPFLRFSYSNTAGSGVVTISIFAKDLN